MKRIRTVIIFFLLAGLILGASGAKGDLLLFATVQDCLSARLKGKTLEAPHAAVLEAAKSKDRDKARKAMAKAGVKDTEFLGLGGVKNRTAEALEAKWATKTNTARVASLLRQNQDNRILYYAENEQDRIFLSAFADMCAAGADDPGCWNEKNKGKMDEYQHEVPLVVDGITGEEHEAPPADTAWKEAWEDRTSYDFSALPETDSEGFLKEGEYVLRDAGQGLWVYLSPTLRVIVTRHKIPKFSWIEADILRRPEGETLHIVTSGNGLGNDPVKVAEENNLVVGINTDFYLGRLRKPKVTGLIIRGGKLIRESSGDIGSSLPTLDTLLLDAEGGFRVDKVGEMDSKKAFELGAVDVLAFGPLLVKDGKVRIMNSAHFFNKEPRTAVGCIGKNHYLMVAAEGRLPSSRGMTLTQLARLMAARRCTDAINMDGGHTSVLIFMGERLNRIGSLAGNGGTSAPRNLAELLGIGTYGQ